MPEKDKIFFINSNTFQGFNFNLIFSFIEETNYENVIFFNAKEAEIPGGNSSDKWFELSKLCKSNGTVFHVVFGTKYQIIYNSINELENIKLYFWPTYLLHFTYHVLVRNHSNLIDDLKIKPNFDNVYCSYNCKPHEFRCELIDNLYKNDLFDCGRISWNNLNHNYNFKYWTQKILILDNFLNSNELVEHVKNNNSFLFLSSESNTEFEFITEKTWKPILIEQPFLLFAKENQNLILKNYGFELFEEIFDYSFDSEKDIEKRIMGIIENLNRLKKYNLYEQYNVIRDKLVYNKNRALQIIYQDEYTPHDFKKLYFEEDLKNNQNFIDNSDSFINSIFENF